ncbi:alpha/beta hydrolase [Brassicibacter mesophilus]|uniref:alpha/beta hydrolase n=1 Tax=Brassicibacter mesophilus TaxID=745119 RepID=UPI003D21CC86
MSIFLLILSIAVYNQILIKVEEHKFNPPGKLIEIDGHKMHIYSIGDINSSPTIVMTCGSGTPSAYTEFSNIQSKLSTITRTSVYERPGYGWSEQSSTSRDTEQIVEDLRRLLNKSGEKPPYLFVAHSMGAMEVLLYTHKYPDEVEGIVLVDGTSPYKHLYHSEASISDFEVQGIKVLNKIGFLRIVLDSELIPMLNNRLNSMNKEVKSIDKAMTYKNILNDMVIKEGYSLKATAEKMYGQLDFGDTPLVLFAADKSMQELPGWEMSQNSLLKLSNNSKLIIVENTDHLSILHDSTEKIENIIEEMIIKIRNK